MAGTTIVEQVLARASDKDRVNPGEIIDVTVVLAMILPIEALRNALVNAFGQITSNLNAIP